jgi:hypothetical protein
MHFLHPEPQMLAHIAIDHPNIFVAQDGDYLCHTDPDQVGLLIDIPVDIICFLDDVPRYLFHREILTGKLPITTSAVLQRTIVQLHPYIMTRDNGSKFIGAEFCKILKNFNIQQWMAKPHTPQQN